MFLPILDLAYDIILNFSSSSVIDIINFKVPKNVLSSRYFPSKARSNGTPYTLPYTLRARPYYRRRVAPSLR